MRQRANHLELERSPSSGSFSLNQQCSQTPTYLDSNSTSASTKSGERRFASTTRPEALLAQLFLKDEGAIPLSAFDALLSVFRNPSFDAKEVKFKDLGDFCSTVASSRGGAVTRRGWESNTGIPEVIVEGVLDVFSEELRAVWDNARRCYHGDMLLEGRRYEDDSSLDDTLATWRYTLLDCALVHSSWLVRTRPLLGYYHTLYASDRYPLTRSLTNPSLGSWTRDLQMKLEERSPFLHGNMINALLCRVPNLRTFYLQTFHYMSRDYDIFLPELCASLSSLANLEEFSFSFSTFEEVNLLVQRLSETPPPNLKIIHFLGECSKRFAPLHVPQWLSPLTSIASLRSVGIHHDGKRRFFNGFIWSRSLASSNRFELDELSIWAIENTPDLDDNVFEALHATNRLNFTCRGGQATAGWILDNCPSLRSLSLIVDSQETEFFELAEVLPSSIEELNISFPPFTKLINTRDYDSGGTEDEFRDYMETVSLTSAKEVSSRLNALDLSIHRALRSGTSPHLRGVKIYIHADTVTENRNVFHSPNHRLLYRKRVKNPQLVGTGEPPSNPTIAPVLPFCQQICHERGILFSVEVLLLKTEID